MNEPQTVAMTESSARIFAELQSATEQLSDWKSIDLAKVPSIHVAIMSEPFLSYVLEGKKTIESRFSLNLDVITFTPIEHRLLEARLEGIR